MRNSAVVETTPQRRQLSANSVDIFDFPLKLVLLCRSRTWRVGAFWISSDILNGNSRAMIYSGAWPFDNRFSIFRSNSYHSPASCEGIFRVSSGINLSVAASPYSASSRPCVSGLPAAQRGASSTVVSRARSRMPRRPLRRLSHGDSSRVARRVCSWRCEIRGAGLHWIALDCLFEAITSNSLAGFVNGAANLFLRGLQSSQH
jgi:hypothetical protein